MFLKGFLQSFFIMVILIGAGTLGYRATIHFWEVTEEDNIAKEKATPTPEPITTASVDDISKNLIYCYDEDTKEISKIVLEIFHCEKKQLTYITIPMETRFTMSDSLYRRMVLIYPEIPQIIKLSAITKYFEKDTVFDYGVLLSEDLLNIDISYYTVIPKSVYDTIFTQGAEQSASETLKVPVEKFTDEYMEFLNTLKTEEELSKYIEDIYPSLQSNLTLLDKMKYLDSYVRTPLTNISFEQISGDDYNSGFVIDEYKTAKRLQSLTSYGEP